MTITVKPTESDLKWVAISTGLEPKEVVFFIRGFRTTDANLSPMRQEDMLLGLLLRFTEDSALILDIGLCAESLRDKIARLSPAQRARASATLQSLTRVGNS